VDRVRWFRASAACDRRKEELEILDEELRRTFTSFMRSAEIWKIIGDRSINNRKSNQQVAIGFRAFAYKQAHMYAKLSQAAETHWVEARSYAQVN
jgi:hypothetical protein